MAKTNKKQKSKQYLVKRFISIVFLIVFSFLVLAGIGAYGYLHFAKNDFDGMMPSQKNQQKKGVMDLFKKTPKKIRTNVAIFGVDKGGMRTDVIIVATFNSETKKINLVSVPRDTRVFLTESMLADMRSRISGVPDTVKINEVHAYAGKEKANEYSVKEVERLLGIDIDYFVKVDIEAFRKIVDQIGGVEMTLDRDYYYVDRAGGLYINLKAGPQTLNGEQAEQLVRYRKDYGDLGRIQTQQKFLKAFAQKMLSPSNIKNAPAIVKILFDYVETDVDLTDALQYVQYLDDIDLNNIEMTTIPGEAQYIGNKSYFIHDEEGTKELVEKIFFSDDKNEATTTANSKNARIEVLNGGSVSGLAQTTGDQLKSDGYNVVHIGNYEGTREQNTRIFVRKEGWGEDLKAYFKNSTVIVDESALSDDVDIQIVLGLSEK